MSRYYSRITWASHRADEAKNKVLLKQEVTPIEQRQIHVPMFSYDPEQALHMSSLQFFLVTSVAYDMIQGMYQRLCSLLTFPEIYWQSTPKNNIFNAPNVDELVDSIRNCQQTTYILPLTLSPATGSNHANILIFDLIRNQYTRFDPHGAVSYQFGRANEVLLDVELQTYLRFVTKKLGWGKPKFIPTLGRCYLGPQIMEIELRQAGLIQPKEPGGYCIAFSYWFVVFKIVNPDLSLDDVFRYFNRIRNIVDTTEDRFNYKIFYSTRGFYQHLTRYYYDRLFHLYQYLQHKPDEDPNILKILTNFFTVETPHWDMLERLAYRENIEKLAALLHRSRPDGEVFSVPPVQTYDIKVQEEKWIDRSRGIIPAPDYKDWLL